MTQDRDEIRKWLRAVLRHLGWSGSHLAGLIHTNPSTINRFLNDNTATHNLSPKNLRAIERVTGFDASVYPERGGHPRSGFAEEEAAPFEINGALNDASIEEVVRAMTAHRQNADAWILQSDALENIGILRGDILIVDLAEKARPRDVVCAQVYDWNAGKTQTIFRIYEKPFLISASARPELMRPFIEDDDAVAIKGVVTHILRPRRATEPTAA